MSLQLRNFLQQSFVISAVFSALTVFCVSATARSFTFSEIVKQSVQVSPELKSSQANKLAAEAEYKEARSSFLPSINLQGSFTDQKVPASLTGGMNVSPSTIYSAGLAFEQPIYLGGKIWAAFHIRKLSSKLAEYQDFIVSQGLLLKNLAAALSLQSQRELLATYVQGQKTQKEFYDVTRRRAKRGGVRGFELDQARANYLSYAPRIEDSKRLEKDAEKKLELALGLAEGTGVQLAMTDPAESSKFKVVLPQTQQELRTYIQQAYQQRAEVKAAELAVRLTKQEKSLNLGDDMPQLAVTGNYGYQNTKSEGLVEDVNKATSLNVSLVIPIFSGFTSVYKRRAGTQKISAKEYDLQVMKRDLEAEVVSSWRELDSVNRRLNQSRSWQKSAGKALRKARSSYKLGAITQTQFIQLQAAWEQANANFIAQKQMYYLAFIQWHKSLGVPLEKVFD